MIDNQPENRPTLQECLECIKKNYSQRNNQNSAIDSLFRFFYSSSLFTNEFINNLNQKLNKNNQLFSSFLLKGINYLPTTFNNNDNWNELLNKIRKALAKKDSEFQTDSELNFPKLIKFYISSMNKELNIMNQKKRLYSNTKDFQLISYISDCKQKYNSVI